MTEQDRFNAELQLKTSLQEAKFNMLVSELKEQREDIRRLQGKQDEDRRVLESKIDKLGDKIQNMVIAAVVGFGVIVFAAVSALK
ncbi:MAG: hypothetical protein IKN16_00995 [Selenomonadaceae bacterium]|nr:hypothetical protein [Selenomonadaceae bacterium]